MKRLLTSFFGLGLLPVCPGTFGSLPPAVLFYLLSVLLISPAIISAVFVIWAIAAAIICVAFSPAVIARTGKIDPGEIVIDEVAGQCVAFIPSIFLTPLEPLFIAGLGFVLFRLFDITKPFPIRKLEKLPAGWGIVADDLLAGVFSAVILLFVTNIFFGL